MHYALVPYEDIKPIDKEKKEKILEEYRSTCLHLLFNFAATSRFGRAMVDRDFTEHDYFMKIMPKFRRVDFFDSVDAARSMLIAEVQFTNKFGHIDTAALPIFVDLLKDPFYEESVTNSDEHASKTEKSSGNYYVGILSRLYNPFILFALGIINSKSLAQSIFNIPNTVRLPVAGEVASENLLQKFTAIYAAPGLLYGINYVVRTAFSYALNSVLNDLRNRRINLASWKLYFLFLPAELLELAGYDDISWFINYLYGKTTRLGGYINSIICCSALSFERSYKYAKTPDQKFISLSEIPTNETNLFPMIEIKKHNREYLDLSDEKRDKFENDIPKWADVFDKDFANMPTDSTLHKMRGERLRQSLLDCISLIRQGKYEEAHKFFYKIQLRGYDRAAYPKYIIVYFQIYMILTLCDRHSPKTSWFELSDDLQNITEISHFLKFMQVMVEKHCPEKAKLHQGVKATYATFGKKVCTEMLQKTDPSPNMLFSNFKSKRKETHNEAECKHDESFKPVRTASVGSAPVI